MKTKAEVIKVLAEALEVDILSISETTDASAIESWDSLGHLKILIKLDQLFDGKTESIERLSEVNSVAEILTILSDSSLID